MSFERAIRFVLAHEGEWADDPDDPGGRTRWGISSRWNEGIDLETLTRERAVAIYRERYWGPIAGEKLPSALGLVLLDWAVLQGPGRAVRGLQGRLGVEADGIVGPKTLEALQHRSARELSQQLVADRKRELLALERSRFTVGWLSRLVDLALEL